MGGRNSKSGLVKKSLHPKEEERILAFFGLKNIKDKISTDNLHVSFNSLFV